jgi:hypothetical protein
MGRIVARPLVLFTLFGLICGTASQGAAKTYDPDQGACQVETIRRTFRANLLPWQDQHESVQQRLRILQAAMTLDTLKSCQARGLLSQEQVGTLIRELGLATSPPAGAAPSPPDSQSPTRP